MKNHRYFLFAATVLVAACFAQSAVAQSATTMLPVYEVTTAGATETQARRLSDALKTPIERLAVAWPRPWARLAPAASTTRTITTWAKGRRVRRSYRPISKGSGTFTNRGATLAFQKWHK